MKLKITRQNYLLYLVIFTLILLLFFYLLSDKDAIVRQLYKEFYGASAPTHEGFNLKLSNRWLDNLPRQQSNNAIGLDWAVYRTGYNNDPLGDTSGMTPNHSGTGAYDLSSLGAITKNLINDRTGDHKFTIILKGYFVPNKSGRWTFSTVSDDASYLWLGGSAEKNWNKDNAILFVNNGGLHPMHLEEKTVHLLKNKYYPIRIQMSENDGGYGLTVYWTDPDGKKSSNGMSSNGENLLYPSSISISADLQTSAQNGLTWKWYDGYFGNDRENVNFSSSYTLKDSGKAINTSNLSSITSGKIIENQTNTHRFSLELFGFFYTSTANTDPNLNWTFAINSDDASYLWIGDAARSGWTTGNATINNGSLHGMRRIEKEISLAPNKYYPIRLVYGENDEGFDFQFAWKPPGGNWTSNGYGFLYSDDFSEIPNDHDYQLELGSY